jgi:hypothetical protein
MTITTVIPKENPKAPGCVVKVDDKTDLYSLACDNKTKCTNSCDDNLKKVINKVNKEIKAAQAIKATEVAASNSKYKAARTVSVAKIKKTELNDCNTNCTKEICTKVGNLRTCCNATRCVTTDITTPTPTPTPTPTTGCTETVAKSGAITEKCCSGTPSVCTTKIIAKDSDTCDCDEKYKYAINDAISRNAPSAELAALRARQAACYKKCAPVVVTPVAAKAEEEEVAVTTTPSKITDRRRVVYSTANQ